MVQDVEEDADFAAWLEEAIIVADNLTEKEIENGALPVNGLPVILLPKFNDRVDSFYYHGFTSGPVANEVKEYIVDIYNNRKGGKYAQALPSVGKTLNAICATYNLNDRRVAAWIERKKTNKPFYTQATRPPFLTDANFESLRGDVVKSKSHMDSMPAKVLLANIRAKIGEVTGKSIVRVCRNTFLSYLGHMHCSLVVPQNLSGSRVVAVDGSKDGYRNIYTQTSAIVSLASSCKSYCISNTDGCNLEIHADGKLELVVEPIDDGYFLKSEKLMTILVQPP